MTTISIDGLGTANIHCACGVAFKKYLDMHQNDINHKIEELKNGMDEKSCWQVDRYFKLFDIIVTEMSERMLTFPLCMDIFNDEERFLLSNLKVIYDWLCSKFLKYDMSEIVFSLTNMYYHNGLRLVPELIKNNMNDSVLIDCGAFVGDSAISFLEYNFTKIYSFEPSLKNYNILCKNVKKNKLENIIMPVFSAVSLKSGELKFIGEEQGFSANNMGSQIVKAVSLDEFYKDKHTRIGVIKVDVEGMELDAVMGAENIICKYKPVLLLSVYHTWVDPEQIFTVKKYIESLNLGYKFMFKWLQPDYGMIFEHMLICYCD